MRYKNAVEGSPEMLPSCAVGAESSRNSTSFAGDRAIQRSRRPRRAKEVVRRRWGGPTASSAASRPITVDKSRLPQIPSMHYERAPASEGRGCDGRRLRCAALCMGCAPLRQRWM